jgi:RNAse (barnase) inhibitor barstar
MHLNWFSFDEGFALSQPEVFVFDVPVGIETENELLLAYALGMGFPSYFGYNWDALWDCLMSRENLEGRPVAIRHRDVPLLKVTDQCQIYLELLIGAVDESRRPETGDSDLFVIFPASAKRQLELLPHRSIWFERHPDFADQKE